MTPISDAMRRRIHVALGLTAAFLLVNYSLAPGHAVSLDTLKGFLLPRHGRFTLPGFLANWIGSAGAIAGLLILNAAILGTGFAARRFLKLKTGPVLAWLLGLAPSGLPILGGGLCGLFGKTLMVAWIAAGILALFVPGNDLRGIVSRRRLEPGLLLALVPCLLGLPVALSPELGFDALRYHQGLPKLYLEAHRVFHVERFLFCSFPSLFEMLYAAALSIATPVTAKLLNWQFLPLATVLLWRALSGRLSPVPAALVCAGFAATPFLASLTVFANVDLGLMTVEFAAVLAVLGALESGGRSRYRLAGWLIGTAFGIKYLGMFGAGAILAALVIADRRRIPACIVQALPFVVILTAPWRIKNLLFTGDPLYPYAQFLFGAFDIEPDTLERHLAYAAQWRRDFPAGSAWFRVFGIAFTQGIYARQGEALAPLLFFLPAAIPAARLIGGGRFDAGDRFLAWFCAILYFAWSHAGGGIFRFLAPLFPAGMLLAGRLLPRLGFAPPFVTAGLSLALLFQVPILVTAQYYQGDPAERAWGFERDMQYVNRIVPPNGRHLSALERAGREVRPLRARARRLLLEGDIQGFYSPVPVTTQFEFAPPLLHKLAGESADTSRMRVRLRQRGIVAMLYRVDGMVSVQEMSQSVLAPPAALRLQEFRRDYVEPKWAEDYPEQGSFYQCHLLRNSPGPFKPAPTILRFDLPGVEYLSRDIDIAIEAGRKSEAFELSRALTRERPDLAQAWLRLYLTARRLGRASEAARASSELNRLGYSALIR